LARRMIPKSKTSLKNSGKIVKTSIFIRNASILLAMNAASVQTAVSLPATFASKMLAFLQSKIQ